MSRETTVPFMVDPVTIRAGGVIDPSPDGRYMQHVAIAVGITRLNWYISLKPLRLEILGEALDVLEGREQLAKSPTAVRRLFKDYQELHPNSKYVLGPAAYVSSGSGYPRVRFNHYTIGIWERVDPGDRVVIFEYSGRGQLYTARQIV